MTPGIGPRLRAIERFWAKVQKGDPDECWPWMGYRDPDGYGRTGSRHLPSVLVHRTAYELEVGPIPPGLTLDHKCRTRACCNPAHLEPVTRVENIKRGIVGETNRKKTHCPKGHGYSGENLIIRRGRRHCRTCCREQDMLRKRRYRLSRS